MGILHPSHERSYVYETIVHPTDGSPCSARGLEHAISLAKEYDAELHVLYVVEDPDVPVSGDRPSLVTELAGVGESVLDSAENRARDAGLYPVSTHLGRGTTYQRILGFVDDRNADLVVMGTHGRSGLDRLLLGSTTEWVLRRATVPLLAVEPLDRGE